MDYLNNKTELIANGFTVIEDVFSEKEIYAIIQVIEQADASGATFRKSTDLFAIRQFLKEVPEVQTLVFSECIRSLINDLFGKDYLVVNQSILISRVNPIGLSRITRT